MTTILPHGGQLIQRIVKEEERDQLLAQAQQWKQIPINTWTISDLIL